MALSKYSKFYFGIMVTPDTRFFNFKEGAGPELTFELFPRGYALSEIALAIETGLNETGNLDYTVTVDRTNRLLTISGSGLFSLLFNTGVNASEGVYPVIGFNPTDLLNVTTATSDFAIGKVFSPQFILQDYVPKEQNRRSLSAVVSKSASGRNITVQNFGEEVFIDFSLEYITNLYQAPGGRLRNNPTGYEDAIEFLTFATQKEKFEFMEDENKPEIFSVVILESIGSERDGIGFSLRETYDRNLPFYFESGNIKLRVVS